jgi:Fe-S cluster assembly ATP-binding protein|tara:strand:+ start:116 stop:880 length:765 start_codon:yes stop_codon:yes gene_type:complete
MLKIDNLEVSLEEEDKQIIKGLSLSINPGEIHAIMGPNGSGKSTLSSVLAGKDGYIVNNGNVQFDGSDLLDAEVEERAALGIFLAFQYPIEIPGVGNMNFLRTALNSQRKTRGQEELNAADFLKLVRSIAKDLEISDEMMKRPVNVGASGGEKKRNEILQMCLLEPRFVILDETDSGLDVDAMKLVSRGVNNFLSTSRSFLVITHYQRLLNYIVPDFVHIMVDGRIVKTGDKKLALHVEETGYKDFLQLGKEKH